MGLLKNKSLGFISLLCILALACNSNKKAASDDLKIKALNTLEKATDFMESISTEGGYLWRYSLDFGTVMGEREATPTQIWVQDGTPQMGMVFLKMFQVTKNKKYLENARDVAMALVNGQLKSGGWDYLIEFDPEKRKNYSYRVDEDNTPDQMNRTTFDDNNTQGALSFLLSYLDIEKNSKVREAVEYCFDKIIEAQYPIGAWPQRWEGEPHDESEYPIKKATIPNSYPREQPDGPYYGHYTFNDNTHRDLVMVLLQGWKQTNKEKYLKAAKKGADYLIYSQLPEPQPVWAQQYNKKMEPAWARAFEPPSATAGESTGVIRMLVDMYLELGDEKYLKPIPKAIKWFERSEIRPNTWARMYELGTNRPIYGDRDKKIHYTLEEISDERKTGYSWEGEFGVAHAIDYYKSVKSAGREKWLASIQDGSKKKPGSNQKLKIERQAREVIQSLDNQNRWIYQGSAKPIDSNINEWITIDLYIKNVEILCQYLDLIEG